MNPKAFSASFLNWVGFDICLSCPSGLWWFEFFLGKHSCFDFSSQKIFPIFPGVKKYNFLNLHFWKVNDTFYYISFIVFNQMRFQFHDYFGPNVTGTRKLFQKFWTTKFHQSEFGRQEPSTKRGSWDGHTQILTCFWPPFYNHNVWKLSAHFFMTFHGYCSFIIMGWNKFWSCIRQKPLFWWRSDTQIREQMSGPGQYLHSDFPP